MADLTRLKRKLRQLPIAAQQQIRPALEQGAQQIVDLAKRLAGDDERLVASIGWTWGDAPDGAMVLASRRAGGLRITVYAGDDRAFWARWREFGTRPRPNKGRFAGTMHPGTPPRPFFYPSYRALRRTVKGRVSRAITRSVKQVAARG